MKASFSLAAMALLPLAMVSAPAFAISPIEQRSYDSLIDQAANVCSNYAGKTAKPAIESLKIATVRVLLTRDVLLCPDNTLSSGQDVIWYGNRRVMVWNPTAQGTNAKVGSLLDGMTRDDTFANDVRVWNAAGEEQKNQVVPALKVSCASTSWRDCARR